MDDPSAQSNPLTAEIKAAFADALSGAPGYPRIDRAPIIYSGAAGLGSRDIRPADFVAVADYMRKGKQPRFFILGVKHDLALITERDPDVRPPKSFSMRGHSVGGYGSVTTNKVIATIVGDLFGLQVQAYPKYGSEKKGLPTAYFLTVADERIRAHSELKYVDFIPLNSINAFHLGNPLEGLAAGGTIFIQHRSRDSAEVWRSIPGYAQEIIHRSHIRVLALDAVKIAEEVSTRPELAQRMQGIVLLGIFLRVAPFIKEQKLDDEALYAAVEKSMRKFFGKHGESVIRDNLNAVKRGNKEVFEIPRETIEVAA
jgi:pyruvate-ferredoxin/flavodoxin oxidoreductase